ncbi:epoxide hydrolase A-like isoform X1 [Vigna umbellata]|uniref:epoxide hydrolase A-like isoform X1 n=1 Tax=Vigna umbellata TaxID=87088 RepID=UPI001F5F2F01|nr:epoxide hydrolase A-like isoform X1 [Vigna umbellata]
MEGVEHRTVNVNGINMHVAEMGEGPLILFMHGFPDLWFSWRHQMKALASLGYRCVAPDLRGYGDTDVPASPTAYTSLHVVGDLVGLLDEVAGDNEKVFVIGHDWGAMIAWYLSLFRPERIRALVNMSVAFTPRNPKRKPLDTLRAVYGNDYYICRFQVSKHGLSRSEKKMIFCWGKPWFAKWFCCSSGLLQETGNIEAEFEKIGTERVLKEFLTYRNPGPLYLPEGKAFDRPIDSPLKLPSWLSQEECDYYVTKYEKTGFTGGFNYYRNLDLNWELTAPWTGAKVKVPVKFIVGDLDLTYNSPGAKDYIHKGGLKRDVPLLEDVVVIQGAGHFVHQERPDEITKHIYDFVKKF